MLSHVQLEMPWTVAHQVPLSIGFSRQEYLSGLPFPFPGDLPNPGIEHWSPALQADSLLTELPGKPSLIQPENHPNPAAHKNFHISAYRFLVRVLHPHRTIQPNSVLDTSNITDGLSELGPDNMVSAAPLSQAFPSAPEAHHLPKVPLHQADLDTGLGPLPTSQLYLQRL